MPNANVYTAALMEHNMHPDCKYELEDFTHEHEGVNPSCGDQLVLRLRLAQDGSRIEEAAFTGSGCAVSQASADIMADLITDKTPTEAQALAELFLAMIRGEATSEQELAPLGEAAQLQGISRMPARVKCAELAWRTALVMLADQR
jgi:nitrogen fixation NifU-like protein